MKPPFRLVGRYVDAFGTTWEIYQAKAAPSLAPKPSPSPFDPMAAWAAADAARLAAEQKKQQEKKGDVPWE